MNYILIYLLLLPFKKIIKYFKKKDKKNLIIHTAKIGDFINITPMLRALGQSDVLVSRIVEPLVRYDNTIFYYYLIEKVKYSFFSKIKFVFKLMNYYDNVYLTYPNTFNLFLTSLCNASNKQFLKTYSYKPYHKIFYLTATGIVKHSKNDLTINSYLKLINRNFNYTDFPKHATSPLHIPVKDPFIFDKYKNIKNIKIGISISAGNTAKTIPPSVWVKIINSLNDLSCIFFVFGVPKEQHFLDKLLKFTGKRSNIVNLIGKLKLEDVPWAIAQMNFYISSDTGNAYIADSQKISTIMFYGASEMREQRPTYNVLLIGPENIIPSNFIFRTRFQFDQSSDVLFSLNENQISEIKKFISNNMEKSK